VHPRQQAANALSRPEGGQHINPTWNTLSRCALALDKAIDLVLRDVPAPATAAGKSGAAETAAEDAAKAKKPEMKWLSVRNEFLWRRIM
jgi:hypothetical protein